MIIGWILYTKEGKNTANNIVNKAVNIAKSTVTRIPEHWEGKDALAYAGIGAVGGAGLGFLINNIKNRK